MREIKFIFHPASQSEDTLVERFNTFRRHILDTYLFEDLEEEREIIAAWIEDYNQIRPHDALSGLSPVEYSSAKAAK